MTKKKEKNKVCFFGKTPKLLAAIVFCTAVVFSAASRASAGVGMRIVHPASGAATTLARPMIMVDFTMMDTPVATPTVKIIFDYADVTDAAAVTTEYALYRPPIDLVQGRYEVEVIAKDVDGMKVEPLAWWFEVGAQAPEPARAEPEKKTPPTKRKTVAVRPTALKREPADNVNGRMAFSMAYVQAEYASAGGYEISDIMPEMEGFKHNIDLKINDVSDKRVIVADYRRETQLYSGREIDGGSLSYSTEEFDAQVGKFWLRTSDLTVVGAEVAGARVEKVDGAWAYTLFSGRTQDSSVSGTFKQMSSGLRGVYTWDARNKTSLMIISADEKNNDAYSLSGTRAPANDRIVSARHEHRFDENTSASLEIANDRRRVEGGESTSDGAYILSVKAKNGRASGEIRTFDIGENYLPVANGNGRFLNSNRNGYKGKMAVKAASWLNVGGEYEKYDGSDATAGDVSTKRRSTYVAVVSEALPRVTYRSSALTTSAGVSSDVDSFTILYRLPSAGDWKNARVSAIWRNNSYEAVAARTNSETYSMEFGASFRRRFGFNALFSNGDVEDAIRSASTDSRKTILRIDWDVVPSLLSMTGKYEVAKRSGNTTETDDRRFGTMVKYVDDKAYAYTFGWDLVSYSDSINTEFSYDQSVMRSGVEFSF